MLSYRLSFNVDDARWSILMCSIYWNECNGFEEWVSIVVSFMMSFPFIGVWMWVLYVLNTKILTEWGDTRIGVLLVKCDILPYSDRFREGWKGFQWVTFVYYLDNEENYKQYFHISLKSLYPIHTVSHCFIHFICVNNSLLDLTSFFTSNQSTPSHNHSNTL